VAGALGAVPTDALIVAGPPGAVPTDALAAVGSLDALRQFGAVRAVRAVMTPTADAVAFAVTNLGDTWFLMVALTLFYWYGSEQGGSDAPAGSRARGARGRADGALAVALALGGLALVVALKHLFGLPRPPAALRAYPADGLGFPSGHALGSTVAWGAMAALGARWDRRRALAVAAPVVLAVGLSRVVLGVHYLGSVLAGFAVGAAFLAAGLRYVRGTPLLAFAAAGALAVLAAATGAVADGATALGGAVGGAVVVRTLDLEGPVHPAVAVASLAVFGGLFVAALALEPPWPVLLAANAVVVGGLLAVPAAGRRLSADGA